LAQRGHATVDAQKRPKLGCRRSCRSHSRQGTGWVPKVCMWWRRESFCPCRTSTPVFQFGSIHFTEPPCAEAFVRIEFCICDVSIRQPQKVRGLWQLIKNFVESLIAGVYWSVYMT
jgi:hypothetical protein